MNLLLRRLFKSFNEKGIPFCVLHSYQRLDNTITSDIDICIGKCSEETLDAIISDFSYHCSMDLIQKLYYDVPSGFYYVLVSRNLRFLQLDFMNDHIGINRYVLRAADFLTDNKLYQGFNIPVSEIEAIYLIIKKSVKGFFSISHRKRLIELYREKRIEIERLIGIYFGFYNIRTFRKLLASDQEDNRFLLNTLRNSLFLRNILLKPWKWPLIVYYQTIRILHRAIRPTGIFVAILSPDGGGKSSASERLLEKLLGGFRKTTHLHWRPNLLPQLKTIFSPTRSTRKDSITHFPDSNKRNRMLSFLRWLYYVLDYILGYYFKILPMKMKTTAIMMDRYYYDIVIDPARYGFNLPRWLFKLGRYIVPKPDLTIYLDNTPEALYSRKQELSIEELNRQIRVWRNFIADLPNAKIVTTDKPLKEVIDIVVRLVLTKRAELTRRTLKINPDECKYLWRSKASCDYLALPSKSNCRWVMPSDSVLAEKSWTLYRPYSIRGRIYKEFMKILMKAGCLKFYVRNRLSLRDTDESKEFNRILQKLFDRRNLTLALSIGTPGPFQKITCMVFDPEGKTLGYVKIGEKPHAVERVKNEAKALKKLRSSFTDTCILIPDCLYEGGLGKAYVIVLSSPPFVTKDGSMDFDENYADILNELIMKTRTKRSYIKSKFFRKMGSAIEDYPLSYIELLKKAFILLKANIENKDIVFSFSHGDFVPWNIILSGKKAFIYDWESADFEAPVGIDLVHFLFQTGFLLRKLRGNRLLDFIADKEPYHTFGEQQDHELMNSKDLLLVYLLKKAVDEDEEQLLSKSAVERRNLIKLMISNEQG